MTKTYLGLVGGALLFASSLTHAQPAEEALPKDIAYRRATVVSEGIRLAADVFALKENADKVLPTIIMSHGWGGVARSLWPQALEFTRAGYFVVVFDYRGWGASEGRVLLTKPLARDKSGGPITAEVTEVREIIDPLDQATDLLNVIHWVHGEKQCDSKRIGLWGTSYSGGHVVYAAAKDPRVKATVSQVPGMDSKFVLIGAGRKQTLDEATKRARGEIGYPEPGIKAVGNLRGAPIRERLMYYAPVEDADKAPGCAMLFIIAGKEELFDNRDHGIKAHQRAKGPKKLVTIPNITHYGIYNEARAQAQKLAIEWFDEHLKGELKSEASKK
ncbi:MAG TPA: alpha/beta fold hydrolase [Gemmataceae bacterium]|nr:alpha/beta fold hydrolase [Gemmataceae bacterium]